MLSRAGVWAAVVAGFLWTGVELAEGQVPKAAEAYKPTEAERSEIIARTAELSRALKGLQGKVGEGRRPPIGLSGSMSSVSPRTWLGP